MTWLSFIFKSLKNRATTTLLTVVSIALSVMLLVGVEVVQEAAEEGFTQSVSNTDLIVGAKSGPIQLILYTVFNMGSATNNVSFETWQKYQQHPAVEWTIPYSLGDSHRGFRVVGTNADFFKHYQFRGDQKISFQQGVEFSGIWDVVLGGEVAESLGYKLGDPIVVAHGVTKGEGIVHHDDKPFKVVGILNKTGTPVDRSLYVSLKSLEAIHIDWQSGAMPTRETAVPAEQIREEELQVQSITAFFLRTKGRIETLRLQREINTDSSEALLAIIPAVTLSELWRSLSYAEKVLRLISWMVVAVGLVSMLIALLTSLNERRREMAILRAIGCRPQQLSLLLIAESFMITVTGIIAGLFFATALVFLVRPWMASEFGFYLEAQILNLRVISFLAAMLVAGLFIGILPGLQARRQSLKDGLSLRL
ncbi:MAG: ABC transporter permease [Bdellovibrionia bacterium]